MTVLRKSSRSGWITAVLIALAAARGAGAGAELGLKVTEVARSVDLSRGGAEFLTVTVELSGEEPDRLRRVQPLREEFRLVAGKRELPCRWLRGGSVPDDPRRLRFTLGFSPPPAEVRRVTLEARLPRTAGDAAWELRLTDLQPGTVAQPRSGPGWSLQVLEFGERQYVAPALPPSGRFFSKAGPVDARIFRRTEEAPERAILLRLNSRSPELYDATVDVSGTLLVEGGPAAPLLAALLRRDPSRTVENPIYGPIVTGEFYFPVPRKGRPTGALLRLERRDGGTDRTLRIEGLPVPGGARP